MEMEMEKAISAAAAAVADIYNLDPASLQYANTEYYPATQLPRPSDSIGELCRIAPVLQGSCRARLHSACWARGGVEDAGQSCALRRWDSGEAWNSSGAEVCSEEMTS
jgi:hypothetical protein